MTAIYMSDGRRFEVEEPADMIRNQKIGGGQLKAVGPSFVALTKAEDGLPIYINPDFIAYMTSGDDET